MSETIISGIPTPDWPVRMDQNMEAAWVVAERLEQLARVPFTGSFSRGLNPAQWAALRYLANAGLTASTVTAFARFHGTTKGTASQTVSALVKKGHVLRHTSPADRRIVHLEVTESGRALLETDPLERLARACGTLPEQERSCLAGAVDKLFAALHAQGAA